MKAEGQAQAKRALADAELYAQEKQAEAVKAKLRAQVRSLLPIPACLGHQHRLLEPHTLSVTAKKDANTWVVSNPPCTMTAWCVQGPCRLMSDDVTHVMVVHTCCINL